jgi:hypothetical protein
MVKYLIDLHFSSSCPLANRQYEVVKIFGLIGIAYIIAGILLPQNVTNAMERVETLPFFSPFIELKSEFWGSLILIGCILYFIGLMSDCISEITDLTLRILGGFIHLFVGLIWFTATTYESVFYIISDYSPEYLPLALMLFIMIDRSVKYIIWNGSYLLGVINARRANKKGGKWA